MAQRTNRRWLLIHTGAWRGVDCIAARVAGVHLASSRGRHCQVGDDAVRRKWKDAKYGFGQLIDLTRAAPVAVSKHGRPVVVVVAVEEFERMKN